MLIYVILIVSTLLIFSIRPGLISDKWYHIIGVTAIVLGCINIFISIRKNNKD